MVIFVITMKTTHRKFFRPGVVATALLMLVTFFSATVPVTTDNVTQPIEPQADVYSKLNLQQLGLSPMVYRAAVNGWQKLRSRGAVTKNIIAICDFTQSSNNRRLYVIDMMNGTLLFNTLVAHGRNTGEEFARSFSNEPESHKSSLGFYTTGDTYFGEHGLSLKLQGREPGFNDKAEARSIVMHGADYVCDNFICQFGRLGRSFGCPSVPYGQHEQIINAIKGGSCLFVYYPDKKYLSASRLVK